MAMLSIDVFYIYRQNKCHNSICRDQIEQQNIVSFLDVWRIPVGTLRLSVDPPIAMVKAFHTKYS